MPLPVERGGGVVVSTRGWPALLQQHKHMSVPYSQQMGPLGPLGCTPLSPMGVLPAPPPPFPDTGPTWMSWSCFMSSGGSWVEIPGAEAGDSAQVSLTSFAGGGVPAPYKNGVSLTHKELMEQQSLAESQVRDPCYPYAVLGGEHTCYPHCSDGDTETQSQETACLGSPRECAVTQAWTPCSHPAHKCHTLVGIGTGSPSEATLP